MYVRTRPNSGKRGSRKCVVIKIKERADQTRDKCSGQRPRETTTAVVEEPEPGIEMGMGMGIWVGVAGACGYVLQKCEVDGGGGHYCEQDDGPGYKIA